MYFIQLLNGGTSSSLYIFIKQKKNIFETFW